MEFTKSQGARMLIRIGFRYVVQKEPSNNLQSWECVLRRKGQCKAKVKLHMNGEPVEESNEHTHPSLQVEIEVTKIKASIKRRSQATHDTPQQILGAALQNISETAAVNLPQINNLKRTIHSQRKDNDLPPTPLRREDIPVLPERYQVTKAGEQFLIFDSGVGDNERILIFATQLSKLFIFYPITAIGLWMERLSYVQKYFIKFTPFMPQITIRFSLVCLHFDLTKIKLHTTDFSEKSGMLSSDRGMNLLIFP